MPRQIATSFHAVAALFGNPDMRWLQLSWAAMSFANWSFAIALGVYAFGVGGAAAVGIAGLVRLLPGALASPFAGLLGDRHSRRAVLLASSMGASAVLAVATAGVAADAPAAIVFGLAGLFTILQSPYIPAEGALLPTVARTPQELSAANVAHSAMDNAGFLAGSLLTGLVLTTASIEVAFALAAAAALISVGLTAALSRDSRPDYGPGADGGSVMRETAHGLRVLLGEGQLHLIGTALTLLAFFVGAADVLVVIVALDLLAPRRGQRRVPQCGLGPRGAAGHDPADGGHQ